MEQYDINIREYWRIFKKRKWIVLLATIVLGAASAFFSVFLGPPPMYQSECSIQFNKQMPVQGVYKETLDWSDESSLHAQISLMKSYEVMQKVAERLGYIPVGLTSERLQDERNFAQKIDSLRSRVRVRRERGTNIINIRVRSADPRQAQLTADTVAKVYKEHYMSRRGEMTTAAKGYLTSELEKARKALRKAESEFNTFTREHQLVSIDLQGETLLARDKEIQTALRKNDKALNELSDLGRRLDRFAENPAGYGSDLFSNYANQEYENIRKRLVELLVKRESMLEDFTYNHPEIIGINRRIVETARKMAVVVRAQESRLEKSREELREEQIAVKSKINELMERKLTYDRLSRKVQSLNEQVISLESKNREAEIRQAERPEEIVIVKPAFLPSTPLKTPRVGVITSIGVFIGFLLGMISALVVEAFDTSVGATGEVEETVGTKVIGVIPDEGIKEMRQLLKEERETNGYTSSLRQSLHLVSHFVPKSMVAESFRALRINVQFFNKERGVKTLAITSATPQEGKTVVSSNLAVSMAQAGKKVLLVGADLRKPMVSEAFGVEINPGLTDILLGNYAWRDAIKTITDLMLGELSIDEILHTPGLDNLHLITAGSMYSNPSELIESRLLGEFLAEVRKEYDVVILDTAPVLSTADLSVLGTMVDSVLMVYRVGGISREMLKRAAVELTRVKSNLMGVILNGMKAGQTADFEDFKAFKYY